MQIEDKEVLVEDVEVFLNKRLLLSVMLMSALTFILAGFLGYIFSKTLLTFLLGIIIALTFGIMINYILIVSSKMITRVDVNLRLEETNEELGSVMKIE